jgi:hypothetical protein
MLVAKNRIESLEINVFNDAQTVEEKKLEEVRQRLVFISAKPEKVTLF